MLFSALACMRRRTYAEKDAERDNDVEQRWVALTQEAKDLILDGVGTCDSVAVVAADDANDDLDDREDDQHHADDEELRVRVRARDCSTVRVECASSEVGAGASAGVSKQSKGRTHDASQQRRCQGCRCK